MFVYITEMKSLENHPIFNSAIKVKETPKEEKKPVTLTDGKEELNFSLFEQADTPPAEKGKILCFFILCYVLLFYFLYYVVCGILLFCMVLFILFFILFYFLVIILIFDIFIGYLHFMLLCFMFFYICIKQIKLL